MIAAMISNGRITQSRDISSAEERPKVTLQQQPMMSDSLPMIINEQ